MLVMGSSGRVRAGCGTPLCLEPGEAGAGLVLGEGRTHSEIFFAGGIACLAADAVEVGDPAPFLDGPGPLGGESREMRLGLGFICCV